MLMPMRLNTWFSVWLCCLLAVSLPSVPLMTCWAQEDFRSETNDSNEEDPTEIVDDLLVSHSRSEVRRTHRQRTSPPAFGRESITSLRLRTVFTPLGGQGSRSGRSPPMHC